MMNKIGSHKKNVLVLTNLFIFLAVLSDVPLIILFTVAGSVFSAEMRVFGQGPVVWY